MEILILKGWGPEVLIFLLIFSGSGTDKIDFKGLGTGNIDLERSGELQYRFLEVRGPKILIFSDSKTEILIFSGPGTEHIDS